MSKRPPFSMLAAGAAPRTQAVLASTVAHEGEGEAQPVAELQRRVEAAVGASAGKASRPSSRQGKRALTTWVDKAASKQLAQLALNKDCSKEQLLRDALNDLFDRNGFARLA